MKKKVFILATICLVTVCLVACNNSEVGGQETETNQETKVVNSDYMEKYLENMSSDKERNDFLDYWHSVKTYCTGLEYELSDVDNSQKYEFDPTDEASIPEEIKDIYDFTEIKLYDRKGIHKDFRLIIDGKKLFLQFDGEEFYPTTYGYSDLQKLIETINEE